MKNNRILLTLKYTTFMSVVLVVSLIIIYMVSERARHDAFNGTLRSEAITKANLFLENRVDAATMQHIYLNNTQFINEVEVAVYTLDNRMLYHDAAEHDIVKETPQMLKQIREKGEIEIPVAGGYQAVGILYEAPSNYLKADGSAPDAILTSSKDKKRTVIITAAAHDGYGEANMAALRTTLLTIFLISIIFMIVVGYVLATLTIRPIERALTSQKMFASNVSHELRTPLAAIMGELGLALQKERTPAEYQSRIQRALGDASRMSDTIIGLLNLARAEYDASQIKMEPIRIDELLMDVTEEMLRAKQEYHTNIGFADEPESDDCLSVTANRYLLALAIRNLIENNCKYSSDHTCNILIHTKSSLSTTFSDQGQGMSSIEQENLFRPFYRGNNTSSGHGIGMALVSRIVKLHRFSVSIH